MFPNKRSWGIFFLLLFSLVVGFAISMNSPLGSFIGLSSSPSTYYPFIVLFLLGFVFILASDLFHVNQLRRVK